MNKYKGRVGNLKKRKSRSAAKNKGSEIKKITMWVNDGIRGFKVTFNESQLAKKKEKYPNSVIIPN